MFGIVLNWMGVLVRIVDGMSVMVLFLVLLIVILFESWFFF